MTKDYKNHLGCNELQRLLPTSIVDSKSISILSLNTLHRDTRRWCCEAREKNMICEYSVLKFISGSGKSILFPEPLMMGTKSTLADSASSSG